MHGHMNVKSIEVGLFNSSSCSKVLLKKPTVSQLVEIFPAFFGTQTFFCYALTRVCCLSRSWARWNQSTPYHHISL